ncbi:Putative glycoside hydrolase superfamily [Septoria linicola]|uniref:Glycoside hydrolase superfamily n=1 Tax=Septoria linicola TaxID=215465 RepID=A0A9Q9EK41_9PEZI|nr:putative glycoside hydrolase superfamily [Septoria linicola]USW52859.1 Putative glycoside hydrolase superfamily [Septoria linicola]
MQYQIIAFLAALTQVSEVLGANVVPKRAGLSGYIGIQNTQAFKDLAPYIGWYSDYNPDTPSVGNVQGVPMLWAGTGSSCDVAAERIQRFKNTVAKSTPKLMFGFYEPDCNCPYSSQMTVEAAANNWNNLLVPIAKKGTVLGSPSMCKQFDEDFLTPFKAKITSPWNITSIHVNKPNLAGIKADVEYYRKKYGKPIFVSEFACVHDQGGFSPCSTQAEVDQFLKDAVKYFQSQSDVVGYGPSNGAGLGNVVPLTTSNGQLTASGRTYLNAIKNL